MQSQRCCLAPFFEPGAIPISQAPSASGFGRVSRAANWLGVSSSHLSSPGSSRNWLWGPQNLLALKLRVRVEAEAGFGWSGRVGGP